MPPPHDRSGELLPLEFSLAKAELAVEWLPTDSKEFRRARKRWTDFVRASKLLTSPPLHSLDCITVCLCPLQSHGRNPRFDCFGARVRDLTEGALGGRACRSSLRMSSIICNRIFSAATRHSEVCVSYLETGTPSDSLRHPSLARCYLHRCAPVRALHRNRELRDIAGRRRSGAHLLALTNP